MELDSPTILTDRTTTIKNNKVIRFLRHRNLIMMDPLIRFIHLAVLFRNLDKFLMRHTGHDEDRDVIANRRGRETRIFIDLRTEEYGCVTLVP